ncbi:porin family protein [Mucilaginibacter sp. OK098]|uniref:porin family protein n=1 Tax=Mucilaginibacter sp. OK098 TaxID=1855297 RepID=UPI0009187A50|nr:porin family protein [Mucilaginibacter sp. OK098]SHN37400.1 Outer membrane protein beta-barrel domain-containing protein [Mucilaginibacter sp. OK098]
MKKIFLMLFVLALSLPIFAQSVKFGAKAGLNESTADVGKTSSDISNLSGLNAGAFAEFEFGKISLQPGLYFTQKGFNSKTSIIVPTPQGGPSGSFNASGRVRLNYLQLPVNILYNIAIKPGKIFFGGGPYYGYALSGNVKGNTISIYPGQGNFTDSQNNNIVFGGDNGYKRSDFGVNALAGIQLKNGLLFSINYEYGLTNIYKSANANTIKNRVLGFSTGFQFL